MSEVTLDKFIYLTNNELALVLHCSLKDYYIFKKSNKIARNYLLNSGYMGLIEIDFLEIESYISNLLSIAKFRMIKPDINEEDVDITIDNVVFALKKIQYDYIARIKALGYDPYYLGKDIILREQEICCYFDNLIENYKKIHLSPKRQRVEIS